MRPLRSASANRDLAVAFLVAVDVEGLAVLGDFDSLTAGQWSEVTGPAFTVPNAGGSKVAPREVVEFGFAVFGVAVMTEAAIG